MKRLKALRHYLVRESSCLPEMTRWWIFILRSLFGWFITAYAVSLGTPFWFDMPDKLIVIRSAVKPHEKSQEDVSKN
jgi:hypothetical protein